MKYLFAIVFISLALDAQIVVLSEAQEADWQIKTQKAQPADRVPLGEFIAKVVTPPSLMQSISLPFEANILQLNAAKHMQIKRGDLLAKVTGAEWIDVQKEAVADALALIQQQNTYKRKEKLCKEGIIPQKECSKAKTELDTLKIRHEASKAMLKSYGASEPMIETLYRTLRISSFLPIVSQIEGSIYEIDASLGKSISPSQALFVVHQKGNLWLESSIELRYAKRLRNSQGVTLHFAGEMFESKVLERASIVDPATQTLLVRFEVPLRTSLLSGTKSNVKVELKIPSLRISKSAVINQDNKKILFVKTKEGYVSMEVAIIGEDETDYFIEDRPELHQPIAVSSIAILKNLTGEEDE